VYIIEIKQKDTHFAVAVLTAYSCKFMLWIVFQLLFFELSESALYVSTDSERVDGKVKCNGPL